MGPVWRRLSPMNIEPVASLPAEGSNSPLFYLSRADRGLLCMYLLKGEERAPVSGQVPRLSRLR